MSKRQAPVAGDGGIGSSPPFLPLEESMSVHSRAGTDTESSLDDFQLERDDEYDSGIIESQDTSSSLSMSKKNDDGLSDATKTPKRYNGKRRDKTSTTFTAVTPSSSFWKKAKIPETKQIVLAIVGLFLVTILWDCFFVEPENRFIKPDFSDRFLMWVQLNPGWGLGAILIVIAAAVVSLVPIGTPLTLGCGYIYRGVYGWKLGIFVSTAVSMAGSTLGAVICFLLGRYLMRDTVKRWVRNYPMFDAIDVGKFVVFVLFVLFVCRCIARSETVGLYRRRAPRETIRNRKRTDAFTDRRNTFCFAPMGSKRNTVTPFL
mmetsp:Transcript_793/g.1673  ORF Transcript_793/g.1673 Transcript_793/m.1673 type:complete len:317 (+) Transcript_793:78-1028(+)